MRRRASGIELDADRIDREGVTHELGGVPVRLRGLVKSPRPGEDGGRQSAALNVNPSGTGPPMLDPCGPTTNTSPPCVAAKDLAAECYKAPINKNFCGMRSGPADMLARAGDTAPLSSDCAQGREPVSGADARHAQPAMDGMADTRGNVSEARFLDDVSSR